MNEKLKNCKACEREIAVKVKKCPHWVKTKEVFSRHNSSLFTHCLSFRRHWLTC